MKNEGMRSIFGVPIDVKSEGRGKIINYITIIVVFFIGTNCMVANFLPGMYVVINSEKNTTLKVSTKSLYVNDIRDRYKNMPSMYKSHPELIKPSNDSSYLKLIEGIIIDSAFINHIDDSFFELRKGDTLKDIGVYRTNFNYDGLIANIIKNNITLCSLRISLEYLHSFPKNIDKIKGLTTLSVDFAEQNYSLNNVINRSISKALYGEAIDFIGLEMDDDVYNMQSIEMLKFNHRKSIINNKKLLKLKNLRTLEILNSDSVFISDELHLNSKLTIIRLKSCKLVGNTLDNICNFDHLKSLILEDCHVSDNMINLEKLQELKFLNLRENKFKYFPEVIFSLQKLTTFYFEDNRIVDLPIDLILKLPKREYPLYIGITALHLNDKTKNIIISNEKLLESRGYDFHLFPASVFINKK